MRMNWQTEERAPPRGRANRSGNGEVPRGASDKSKKEQEESIRKKFDYGFYRKDRQGRSKLIWDWLV